MLNRIKIDTITYEKIIKTFPDFVLYTSASKYIASGYSQKSVIVVDTEEHSLICKGSVINYITGNKRLVSWKQMFCVTDNSLEEGEIEPLPYSFQANSKIDSIINKKYTDDEIDEIYNKHSLEYGKTIKHQLLPDRFLDDRVHKFTDCVYYDINGAHTDALCELFPRCKKEFMKLHKNGGKIYINIFVGDLCNRGRRGVYNWVVDRTRKYLDEIIKVSGGEVIYANTDGVIIHHPINYLETSSEVGAFKSEIIDDVIYAYYCPNDKETTSYTIYEYNNPKNGVVLKGNSLTALRKGMSLSQGIINKAKVYKDKDTGLKVIDNFRTEVREVYEEI